MGGVGGVVTGWLAGCLPDKPTPHNQQTSYLLGDVGRDGGEGQGLLAVARVGAHEDQGDGDAEPQGEELEHCVFGVGGGGGETGCWLIVRDIYIYICIIYIYGMEI